MVSALDRAKRALVVVLRSLASTYRCSVNVTRDSSDAEVRKAYRAISRRTHPDRGGSTADQQKLNDAYDSWCQASRDRGRAGRPSTQQQAEQQQQQQGGLAAQPAEEMDGSSAFKFRSEAVLLTYQGFSEVVATALEQWRRFVTWVGGLLGGWGATLWTATLETNKDGKHHAHLMVEFTQRRERDVKDFTFEGLRPNAQANSDTLGDSFAKRRWRASLDRAHFYCWANKLGTVVDDSGQLCVKGNYAPAWTQNSRTYAVEGPWPLKLWKAYKLSDEVYEEYLHLCKDGLPARKRNFEAFKAWREDKELAATTAERHKRIRSNPELFQPFREVPEATAWLSHFHSDALRYPFLLVGR